MQSIPITNARSNLYQIVADANQNHTPIQVTSKKGNAVIVGEEDWENIQETLYLTAIPGMTESIKKGMQESPDQCSTNLDW